MSSNVIPFTRVKEVTDMPLPELRKWLKANRWKSFKATMRGDRVLIERRVR